VKSQLFPRVPRIGGVGPAGSRGHRSPQMTPPKIAGKYDDTVNQTEFSASGRPARGATAASRGRQTARISWRFGLRPRAPKPLSHAALGQPPCSAAMRDDIWTIYVCMPGGETVAPPRMLRRGMFPPAATGRHRPPRPVRVCLPAAGAHIPDRNRCRLDWLDQSFRSPAASRSIASRPRRLSVAHPRTVRRVGRPGGPCRPSPSCGRVRRPRRGAGVVERGGLENRCARKRTVGSNPTPSARFHKDFRSLPG
jgi:hypothetical protein